MNEPVPTIRQPLQLFKLLILSISIEPCVFLFAGAFDVYQTIYSTGLYWKICEQKFGDINHTDCHSRNFTPAIENTLQRETAKWKMYIGLATVIPLIIVGPLYGSFGDKHGRKTPLLMGLAGCLMLAFFLQIQLTFVSMALWSIAVVAPIIVSITGYIGNVWACAYSYVADETESKDIMTYRFGALQVTAGFESAAYQSYTYAITTNLANIVFSFALGLLIDKLRFAKGLILTLVLYTLSFLFVLVFLRQLPPKDTLARAARIIESRKNTLSGSRKSTTSSQRQSNSRQASTDRDAAKFSAEAGHVTFPENHVPRRCASHQETPPSSSATSVDSEGPLVNGGPRGPRLRGAQPKKPFSHYLKYPVLAYFNLGKEAFQAGIKRRDGRQRTYIWICISAFLVLNFANIGLNILLNLFCLHRPLNWTVKEIAFFHGYTGCVQLVGTLIGILAMKGLNFHETSILCVSMLSAIAKCLMIGLSTTTLMMYIAGLLGILANITYPVLKSLTCQFVEREEIGKIYALFHIATDLAIIISFTALTSIYKASQSVHAGIVFWVVAGLIALSLVGVAWVHVDYRRYRAILLMQRSHSVVHHPVNVVNRH